MSHEKKVMKLYTEEQLRDFIDRNGCIVESDLDEKQLTPIELPSDEEIEKEARLYCNIKESLVLDEKERYYKDFQKYDGFKACAKWMRDKIQGGNK